jgi:hypothetical protein
LTYKTDEIAMVVTTVEMLNETITSPHVGVGVVGRVFHRPSPLDPREVIGVDGRFLDGDRLQHRCPHQGVHFLSRERDGGVSSTGVDALDAGLPHQGKRCAQDDGQAGAGHHGLDQQIPS